MSFDDHKPDDYFPHELRHPSRLRFEYVREKAGIGHDRVRLLVDSTAAVVFSAHASGAWVVSIGSIVGNARAIGQGQSPASSIAIPAFVCIRYMQPPAGR